MSFGLAALVISTSYKIGTAARMGPGYFPRVLGVLLLVLGAALALRGFRATAEAQPSWHWRPLAVVLLGVLVFGLAAPWVGVVVASLILVFVSSTASREFRWKDALISGAIQGVAAVAVFIYGLGLPLPVWPVFIVGGQ